MSSYDDFALPESKMDISETKFRDYYEPYDKVCKRGKIYYSKRRDQWYYKYGTYFKPIHFHSDMGYWSDESRCEATAHECVVLVRGVPLEAVQTRMNSRNKISYDFKNNNWVSATKEPIAWSFELKAWSDNK